MQNITPEHYKKAIREKYLKEKNGDNSYYLEVPSQAKLRDLCWKIFLTNESKDDLQCFELFFKSEFDPSKDAAFNQHLDKFKPIGSFLKGEKEPANFHAVELAAVLVNFELRPFSKFRKQFGRNRAGTQDGEDITREEVAGEKETEDNADLSTGYASSEVKKDGKTPFPKTRTTPQEFIKKKFPIYFWLGVGMIVMLSGWCYSLSQEKQCMHWSQDHYEKVSCNLTESKIGSAASVVPMDDSAFQLKRIKVTDSTVFFLNGEAVIWYAKTSSGSGIEFFNTHGRHPENKNALRPVTQYIIEKYIKK